MINVQFQIQHTQNISIEKFAQLLHDQIGEEANLEVDDIEDWFSFKNAYLLPSSSVVSIYTLQFEPLELRDLSNEKIISNLFGDIRKLQNDNEEAIVETVTKFQDSIVLDKGVKFHEEIYVIEMSLRAILTYIVAYDERADITKLFKDFGGATMPDFKKSKADEFYENEFFYTSFKLYGMFNTPKPLNANDTAKQLQLSSSFDDFRLFLDGRNIKTERHTNFLSSIKQFVEVIEKLRNAIMHNRAISTKVENSYIKSRDDLRPLLDGFWENEKTPIGVYKIWEKYAEQEARTILAKITWDAVNKSINLPELDGFEEEYDDFEQFIFDLEAHIEGIADYLFGDDDDNYEARVMRSYLIVDELLINNYFDEMNSIET